MSAADPATSKAADAPPAPPASLIYPPADIMTIVDKTAEHVAKSGPAFQQLIRDKYRDNSKFSFIYATDPYHAYYSHKVEHYKANASDGSSTAQQQADNPSDTSLVMPEEDKAAADGPEKPADAQFLCPLPMVSAQDLDVIKTTAQFVARNGRSFMQTLAHRESANYQFDFLKPSHTLFAYFRRLVDQYTLVFFPPPSLTERLQSDVRDKARVLRRVEQRMRWAA
ncbi:SF3a splicing factor complex subunit, partial [Kickxella alabastrina]